MEYADDLVPEYTVRHLDYDMTAARPVRTWSLFYGRPTYRVLHYGVDADHPGEEYGPVQHLTSEWAHVGLHDHDYCEISLIRSGHALHRTPYATTPLRATTVIVAAPGHLHSLDELDGLVETHLAFLPDWLADELPGCWNEPALVPLFLSASLFPKPLYPHATQFCLTQEELAAVDGELRAINREWSAETSSLVFLRVCLLKTLIILARAFVREHPDASELPFRKEVWEAMELIEAFVREGEPLDVAEVAHEVALSHKRLDTVFKEATGASPSDYFARRRVQWAARKLLNPSVSITEVAAGCGYADAAHFSNAFRKHYGISPRAYRKMYRATPGAKG